MSRDFGSLMLRLGVGGLMLLHGIHKLINGHDYIISQLQESGLPKVLWLGVPISEVLAPILLILGFATRISAFLIAFTMVMSIVLVKGVEGFFINPATGGVNAELNILFLIAAITIMFIGPGKLAIYQGDKGIFK